MTITMTFQQAMDAEACTESYQRIRRHVGRCPVDTPVPLTTVLDVLGVEDTLWALDVLGETRVLRLFAADCAERVVHLTGPEPRCVQAIRVTRLHARGLASGAELEAAESAARDAARDASRDAARAAAWAAAWAAANAARVGVYANAANAASAAARDASRDAARAAVWEAAKAAEHDWQKERLRAYLNGRRY